MARRRRKNKKGATKTSLSMVMVLGVGLLLAVVAYFLKDSSGRPYQWLGSYVWFIAFTVTFVIGLFYATQFILPLRWQESWSEGLRLVFSYNFPRLAGIFGGRSPRNSSIEAKDIPDGLNMGFMRHGAGILDGNNCLALNRGSVFSRAAGPGYVSLNRGELIDQVVDLRRHLRNLPVKARTRDGIPLEATVSVIFQVKHEDGNSRADLPYPFDPEAVFHVTYLGKFRTDEGSLAWSERISRQATADLIDELSRYTLDELYQLDSSTAPLMEKITKNLERRLMRLYGQYGIAVISVAISGFQLPDEISQQRIENWQADWQKRIRGQKAAGESEAFRQITLARARAQIEIVQGITESIEAMRLSGDVELTDIITLRMMRAVEEAVADDAVQALVPRNEIATMKQAQVYLEEWNKRG